MHGRVGGSSSHPHSAGESSFVVRLRIRSYMRPHSLGRNTSLKLCASPLRPSAQSRLTPESPVPVADAPRPPALVVDPNFSENRCKRLSLAPIVSNVRLSGIPLHKSAAREDTRPPTRFAALVLHANFKCGALQANFKKPSSHVLV